MKSQLRTLAADYAEGKLDRISYLQQRAELIEALVAENISDSLPKKADSVTRINFKSKMYSTPRIRYSTIIWLIILIIFVGVGVWLANGA